MGELKPGWRRMKLGDVVDVITEYWDRNPQDDERFVAGEHIDEGDLRIRRWGLTTDDLVPPTFNRRFRAGDALFHSRNLRKLACPDFDGITGEKIFVLRSRDHGTLLQPLLPFILQTTTFDDYVNRMWAGSTNKFLNKGPLLQYEFALPPLAEQRRIEAVVRASADVVESLQDVAELAVRTRESFSVSAFNADAPRAPVGSLSKFTSGTGISVTTLPQSPSDEAPIPVFGGNGLAGYTTDASVSGLPAVVIVGRVGQNCGVTRLVECPVWITDNAMYPSWLDDSIGMGYLAVTLRGARLNRGKLGEYLPLITQKVVHSVEIPLLPPWAQREIVARFDALDSAVTACRDRLGRANKAHQKLIDACFQSGAV